MSDIVFRKPYGDTFTYRYASGRTVKDRAVRRWIKSLAIPPAWRDVEVSLDRDTRILAHGRDDRDRKQYLYNPQWTTRRQSKKFQRILRFADQLETMRRVTGQHLKSRTVSRQKVLAVMTRMLDEAYFRPGSEAYTRNNETFGLTTLRKKHIDIRKDKVIFEYVGKSHKPQHREIVDKRLVSLIRKLDDMTGYELFDITDKDGNRSKLGPDDLNDYIGEVMGENFTAKDFRTWAGTVLMAVALDELGPTEDVKLSKSNILSAVKSVAEDLGNTPAVTRENYIHPGIITQYEHGRTIDYFRRQLKRYNKKRMSLDEVATLQLLRKAVN